MMLAELTPSMVLLGIALVCGLHAAPAYRREAVTAASLMVATWALYVMAWTRYAPANFLAAHHIPVQPQDLWAMQDAVMGAYVIAVAHDWAWGWALWALLVGQVVCHCLYGVGWPYAAYSDWLDVLFWGQIAVFVMIGGKGVCDRVASLPLVCWLGRSLSAPQKETA